MLKEKIEQAIKDFTQEDLKTNALNFFKTLGYESNKRRDVDLKVFLPNLSHEKALCSQWLSSHLLFQITDSEIQKLNNLFNSAEIENSETKIYSYIFATVELKEKNYSRSKLVEITREINKVSLQPILLLFKHGDSLTLAVIHRRLNKIDSDKDVIEIKKVSLLKDINLNNPHRAHLDILFDVSLPELTKQFKIENFVDLHKAWLQVFSIDKLNERFYQDISNWYFWAITHVIFPLDSRQKKTQEETNSIAVIRLITRLIFVWFLKEKDLVPEHLFNKKTIDKVLNYTDKTNSTYYKAILQNLFFATLNTEMDSRSFVSNQVYQGKNKSHFLTNLYRYARFFKQPEEVLTLFNSVPFLNGGLFDCLDVEEQENGKKVGEIRIDCFSDNLKNESLLKVPDFLFFGDKTEVNLNAIYGTKNKRYEVRGLIPLLNAYKFTVTENTPLEEEIALDPELLGKIFENLLAAYNPETGVTARKQTGSFYTPREIVDYMVDESLIAYFSGVQDLLASASGVCILENKLRNLLSYGELNNPFNEEETNVLIQAIHNLKILDPACGSGAYPMGILHKLVFILRKLDKDNLYWRKIQEDKAVNDTRQAFKLGGHKERDERLTEISEVFEHNASDYGRKLFLIRDCIFGVDIQPVAIQIAKLRFFVSLVIEQKVDDSKKNRGIEPLPNMEMKLIVANSLIGLDFKIAQGDIFYNPVRQLEEAIKSVRLEYFSASTRHKKTALKVKEQALLTALEQELIKVQCGVEQARKIVAWNPYNQNASADFFDKEFMFGLSDGFDIVIGNPPYIQIQKFSGQQCQSDWKNQGFETFEKTGDIYALFIEKGVSLLKQNGLLTFITSNKWMRAGYGKSLREFLATKTSPLKLIDFGGYQVFESATVDSNILITKNGVQDMSCTPALNACTIQKDFTIEANLADYFTAHQQSISLKSNEAWVIASNIEQQIKKKVESIGTPLKNWVGVNIYRGITTGLNEAFVIDTETKERLCQEDSKSVEIIKPILRGRDIKRYCAEWADLWLINSHNNPPINIENYPAIKKHLDKFYSQLEIRQDKGLTPYNLRNCAYLEEFKKEKIVYIEIMTDNEKEGFPFPAFSYADKDIMILNTAYMITGNLYEIKYIISVINSKFGKKLIKFYVNQLQNRQFRMLNQHIRNVPIPKISESEQQPFIELVDKILAAKKQNQETHSLEREIDKRVYQLYDLTDDEIKIVEGGK